MINKSQEKFMTYKILFFQKIGILLLVTFSLLASIRLFTQAVNFQGVVIGNDDISRYENRFSELKKMLYGEGSVGYITDKTPEVVSVKDIASYYLTQYAISPVVVDKEKCNGFIIGNFDSNRSAGNAHNGKLLLIKNFGNGVMLFKGTGESK